MMNKNKDKKQDGQSSLRRRFTRNVSFLFLLHRERVIFKVGDEMIPGGG